MPIVTRGVRLAAGCLLAGAVVFLAALPTEAKHALHLQGALHPWLHVGAFAVLTLLVAGAARWWWLRLLLAGALLALGYATEAHESHGNGWPIEAQDVRIDAAGVALGWTVAEAVHQARSRRRAASGAERRPYRP